ncbi:MAG: type II toxin-antitoxin system prevent-host-death family antitoxin [Candidatus Eremiobacteraeota bacterium]|nr:type II toxin-antitoxin system prevent-host-death family antitoxin [Candidatus Eremiobacteraeota bacterium]
MKLVNLNEAKAQLSRLADAAAEGEDIVIARDGKPLVRLVPFETRKRSDGFGIDRRLGPLPGDFDKTPTDFKEYS